MSLSAAVCLSNYSLGWHAAANLLFLGEYMSNFFLPSARLRTSSPICNSLIIIVSIFQVKHLFAITLLHLFPSYFHVAFVLFPCGDLYFTPFHWNDFRAFIQMLHSFQRKKKWLASLKLSSKPPNQPTSRLPLLSVFLFNHLNKAAATAVDMVFFCRQRLTEWTTLLLEPRAPGRAGEQHLSFHRPSRLY